MMDLSDGLALSLYDLAAVNACGFALASAALPRPEGVPEPRATELALYGGGDFELLFCCPREILPVPGVAATPIGTVTAEAGRVLLDGAPVERRGYEHRW
jgi:thiamine-monophosphate kinase